MAKKIKCKNCGYVMSSDMKQCPNCGWLLEDEEDFVLPSLKHPRIQEEDDDEEFEQVIRRPEPSETATHTFTSLNLEDIDDTDEEKTIVAQPIKSSAKQKANDDLDDFFNLGEMSEPPVNVKTPKVEQEEEEPRKKKKKKKKKSKLWVIPVFIILTLALFAAGVFVVDQITGENFISNVKEWIGYEETSTVIEETAEPTVEPTVEATAEAEVTATPEAEVVEEPATTYPEGSLGHAVIADGPIYTRVSPSTSATSVGSVEIGSEYEVYEIAEADGYTWYRIDESVWVPTDGTWVTFTQYE